MTKRIVIDARESGTSTGRYVDKLIEYLHMLKPELEIIVLTKRQRLEFMKKIAPSFTVVESNFKEFTFSEQIGLRKQINGINADLVHFTMTQQPVLYKGKRITTIHDLTTLRFTNPAKNKYSFKFKQLVYGRVIKKVAKNSETIITPSKFVKQDVARYAGISLNKIVVTYEAADKISVPPQPVPRLKDRRFIMYVGRPTPHKNLSRLIEAFEIIGKKDSGLMLALAGKMDANYKAIEKIVTEKRLADKVVFTDFITEGQLRWMYENTAAYVFPSLSEGFGLPGLEAMAHGAPVVSSNATCLPEIYGNAAMYFDPLDVNEMAESTSKVINNSEYRKKLVAIGKRQATKYSWEDTAIQTLNVYRSLLGD